MAIIDSTPISLLDANDSTATKIAIMATNIANMGKDITELKSDIKSDVADLKQRIDNMGNRYVSQDEFKPVRSIVYGLVGIILTTVIGALISLVLLK